jgi:hypothetical protein
MFIKNPNQKSRPVRYVAIFLFIAVMAVAERATAHCDALDGPVVTDARIALAAADVTPVLKWVRGDDETEIRNAFDRTLTVRAKGDEARELADQFFFETLVRVHRASEGEPFTGLKPAGTDPGLGVHAADHALDEGDVDELVAHTTALVTNGIRNRFERAVHTRAVSNQSVSAGREAVAAYVEFIHYVKRLHEAATSDAAHHANPHAHGEMTSSTAKPSHADHNPQSGHHVQPHANP